MFSKETRIFGIPTIILAIIGFLLFPFNILGTLIIGLISMIWGITGAVKERASGVSFWGGVFGSMDFFLGILILTLGW